MTTLTPPAFGLNRDRGRQSVNVLLAVTQVGAIIWTFTINTRFSFATRAVIEPPVTPAAYTFTIWFVIYAGSLAYAVYQALPAQRDSLLLRRIGWWTAAAFGAATLWALAAGLQWYWTTTILIFALFIPLLATLIVFVHAHAPHTPAERWLVVCPLSIYTGYVTLATIANTASTLTQSGIEVGSGAETIWASALLLVAGSIGVGVTRWSSGNPGYALTLVWGLVGVAVANVIERPNSSVALVAGAAAALVAGAWLHARRQEVL